MAGLGSVSKLIKFANKTLKTASRKNSGKLINTIEDAATGTKIEVFQKKTGSRLLGNRRTVTTRFQEGVEKPLEQTVRQKKGNVLSTYTTKNDFDETEILTQVNTKTGEKSARVNKWLETTNDEGKAVYRPFTTKRVTRSAGSNETLVDDLDYSTGEMKRTTYEKFNNDEGRGIIKEGEISYQKTFVDKENKMHQKNAIKPADESEELNWHDNPFYQLEGQEWKAPSQAAKAPKMSGKRKAAIGLGIGVTGGTALYVADLATSKDNTKPAATDTEADLETDETPVEETAQPEQEEIQEDETPSTPADSTQVAPPAVAPADSTSVAPQDSTQVAPVDSTQVAPAPVAPTDSTTVAPTDSTHVTPPPAPVEQQEETEEEEQQAPVQQTPPANNLFGGTLNEISIKQYDVQPKDCLWNIARRELEKANPGKTVTNAHVLQQVKEFIRLNPQIKNPDLIYPNQKIKTAA